MGDHGCWTFGFALDLGAFVETSWFQSRYLLERHEGPGVWGVYTGFFVRPDLTLLMGRMDFFVGVNRPERVARLTESADNWELGLRLHGRLGL